MKKIWLLLLCTFLVVLSGCFPTGEQNAASDSKQANKSNEPTPDNLDVELDKNLLVKADIAGGENKDYPSLSISPKDFKNDPLKQELVNNKELTDTFENNNEIKPDYKDVYFEFTDGSYMSIELGTVRFEDSFYSDREYSDVIYGAKPNIRSDLHDIYKKTALENINSNDAIEKVKKAANEYGITNLGNPDVIALDLETLENEWEDYEQKDGGHPRKWEKADEAYVVTFPVVHNNLIITNKGYFSNAAEIPVIGSRIVGVVNKDGIIALTLDGIYDTGKTIQNKVNPISLEDALNMVENKYKDVILTDPITISKIALEYVPIVSKQDSISYKLTPAWVFTAKQDVTSSDEKGTNTASDYFTIIIDADTGQELRIGSDY
ncbi:hypothetical protein [Niallia sp. Man26]|uniref:hypothetical protein n=1 Tax=Niallia TaxID=2837506 RepID=UPI001EDA2E58|nr:hypothetical protein [Niallia sp. Man26]UPO90581.1 hypothetical protein L8T27_021260 [Niallia sp. Man26]